MDLCAIDVFVGITMSLRRSTEYPFFSLRQNHMTAVIKMKLAPVHRQKVAAYPTPNQQRLHFLQCEPLHPRLTLDQGAWTKPRSWNEVGKVHLGEQS